MSQARAPCDEASKLDWGGVFFFRVTSATLGLIKTQMDTADGLDRTDLTISVMPIHFTSTIEKFVMVGEGSTSGEPLELHALNFDRLKENVHKVREWDIEGIPHYVVPSLDRGGMHPVEISAALRAIHQAGAVESQGTSAYTVAKSDSQFDALQALEQGCIVSCLLKPSRQPAGLRRPRGS